MSLHQLVGLMQDTIDNLKQQSEQHILWRDDGGCEIKGIPRNKLYIPSPTGKLAHDDNSFVRLMIGPYGSGKTTWALHEMIRRTANMPYWSCGRRRAKWAIVRNTSGELHSTTLKSWLAWFDELGSIQKRQKPFLNYEHQFNDGKGIIDLELIFLALDRPDDVRKIKSLEVTGVYLNELSELPMEVMSHFKGRLNGRYPSREFCNEPYWSGIIADSNPPNDDHWIYKHFYETPVEGYKLFRQPPAMIKNKEGTGWHPNLNAENLKFLSPDYYTKLASGQNDEFIKVYCAGDWGSVGSGKRVYPEFNADLHAVDEIDPIQGEPIHLGFDFGLCYSEDTEVLTKDGWKLFKNVDDKNDLVATRNTENGEMEYTKINFKIERDYEGELLEWSSTEVNFCVTPEHRIPFTYRDTPEKIHFKSAEWLENNHAGHHYVDLCSKWRPDFDFSVSYFGMEAKTFSEFMGIYLSEGCTYKRKNSYKITIYQKKQNPFMQDILDRTKLGWKRYKGSWCVSNSELGKYLKSFGLAGEKYVPSVIKEMPSSLIQDFIYSYTVGDGHIRRRKNGAIEHTVFTISKKMADDFQELAQKAGWNSSLRMVKPQKSIIIEDGEEREIKNNGGFSVTFKKRADRAELLKNNFRKINYRGKIYCLNVPYHTLYVRRNGKPSWNGNTPACVVVQFTQRGQFRILKEYCGTDIGIIHFAELIVLPALRRDFPYCDLGFVIADPSGLNRDTLNEETCEINELNRIGIKTRAARTNAIKPRIDAVRYFLNRMADGKPSLIVSKKNAPTVYRGFTRDYFYKQLAVSGEARYKEEPEKNSASHPHDAVQYLAMEFAGEQIAAQKMVKEDPMAFYNPVMNIFN